MDAGKIWLLIASLAGFGIAAIFATTLYHLGYPEFCRENVIWPNIGRGVLPLATNLQGRKDFDNIGKH